MEWKNSFKFGCDTYLIIDSFAGYSLRTLAQYLKQWRSYVDLQWE